MIKRPDPDFIDCAASHAHEEAARALRLHAHFVDDFDKRVDALLDDANARFVELISEVTSDFDLILREYRSRLSR